MTRSELITHLATRNSQLLPERAKRAVKVPAKYMMHFKAAKELKKRVHYK